MAQPDSNRDLTNGRGAEFDIEELDDPRKELIKNVIDNFDPESNEIDRYILYELTKFREGDSDSEFWRSYEDYSPEYDYKRFTTD